MSGEHHNPRIVRLEVSTGSGSDPVATYHTIEIERARPGRYRSRY
jgi:hypothetical protein